MFRTIVIRGSRPWFYVTCLDCGCQSATFRYNNDEDKLEAAKKTAELWNTGKVIYTGYGD